MSAREQSRTLGTWKAFVSNAGRGPIVKADDLVTALKNGVIRGAAVYATDPESLSAGHSLWRAKNVIVAPHASGNMAHYNERALRILARNLANLPEGKELINKV
ncbi:hypothetical protein BBP40_009805 [Aspergillus hancockii]|nr:hypothetical protein BBP40_009805 [Aspergillus hancockii]